MRVTDVVRGSGRTGMSAGSGRRHAALRRGAGLSLALLLAAAPTAQAQRALPLHLELGAGAAFPAGSNPQSVGTGYQLQAALEATVIGPLALRAEGLFSHFGFTYTPSLPCPFPGCSPTQGRQRTFAGTIDALLQSPGDDAPLVAYLIAGAGIYDYSDSADRYASGTNPGVNGGAGFRLPRLHVFAEVRGHVVANAPNYVPVVVGIRF